MTISGVDVNQLGQLAALAILLEKGRRGSWSGELHVETGMPRTSALVFLKRLEQVGWADSFDDAMAGRRAPRRVYRLSSTGIVAAAQLVKNAANAASTVARISETLP